MPSHPAEDIELEIRDHLAKFIHKRWANACWSILELLRKRADDAGRHEFVRLLQKWVAST